MSLAALGGQVEVPTLGGGRARINIPAGTQGGKQFRLRGKGMSILRRSDRGDLYVEAGVETPVNLSKEQKKLMEKFSELTNEKNSPASSGFFAKVKELWEEFESNHNTFDEKGNKAAAGRARKAIGEIKKLDPIRYTSISLKLVFVGLCLSLIHI